MKAMIMVLAVVVGVLAGMAGMRSVSDFREARELTVQAEKDRKHREFVQELFDERVQLERQYQLDAEALGGEEALKRHMERIRENEQRRREDALVEKLARRIRGE